MMSDMNPVDLTRNDTSALPKTQKRRRSRFPILILVALFGVGYYAYTLTLPPASFSRDTQIEIPGGSTLASTAKILAVNDIIRSPLYFSLLITNSGKEKLISSGTYLFHEPEDVFSVAKRFAAGDHGIETEKVTLPEGLTIKEMATVLERELSTFNADEFLDFSRGKEGYLFPDTYFFFSTATTGEIYFTLVENFEERTADIRASSTLLGKDWSSIVTMASIIEGEAVTKEDRHIVSGILWTRINNGMRLGVDAPFVYIMGKGSLELTQSDLATSSPYNTYRNAGLPPTPINNPGMSALEAALYPSTTPYVYYLSDKEGKMHYARTFAEHKLNKEKYLR